MPPTTADRTEYAPPMRLAMRRRFAELLALALAVVGMTILVAIATYNPLDPSLDTATVARATNIAGPPGAMLADAVLQGFGLAGALPAVALLGWAWRIGSHRGLTVPLLRIAAVLLAIPALAGLLAVAGQFLAPSGSDTGEAFLLWPTEAGLGGAAGTLLVDNIKPVATALGGPIGPIVALAVDIVIATVFGVMALGLTTTEWSAAGRAARGSAVRARQATGVVAQGTSTAVRFGTWLLRWVNGSKPGEGPNILGQDAAAQKLPPAPRQPTAIQLAAQQAAARQNAAALPRGRSEPSVAVPRAAEPPRATRPEEDEDDESFPSPAAAPPAPKLSVFAGAQGNAAKQPASAPLPAEQSWEFPPLGLLTAAPPRHVASQVTEEQMEDNARLLESVLKDYGVQGEIVNIRPGPVVTLYELEPAPGTRAARVIGLADDVARSLAVHAVRIAVVPGRTVLGIEVPNAKRETVYLHELLTSPEWEQQNARLGIALGSNIGGDPVLADLARMPHLLVAGTTGSGKSVGINAMILSLLYKLSPAECRLIMIDPKMLELSVYEGIPHLLSPVVTDPAKAIAALKWTVREMERRYRAMSQLGVRNLAGYNDRVKQAAGKGEVVSRRVQTGFDSETGKPIFEDQALALKTLPLIVVVIDEMADLMMVAGKDIEASVMRLAQMARAAGIHVIMATQRPSVDVITGTIKANFPTRISFRVVNKHDSRTILGEMGAEQLLGQGDMLFQADSRTTRVHGPFVSDREVEDVVAFLREQGEPEYEEDITEAPEEPEQLSLSGIAGASDDEKSLFDMAVDIVTRDGKASTSYLQRMLKIGYNRAATLIEQMEREGVISPANHAGKREIYTRKRGPEEE
jgi:DNA segregation ATPase FtsK/SpoIIIE, S-DNA-T family